MLVDREAQLCGQAPNRPLELLVLERLQPAAALADDVVVVLAAATTLRAHGRRVRDQLA